MQSNAKDFIPWHERSLFHSLEDVISSLLEYLGWRTKMENRFFLLCIIVFNNVFNIFIQITRAKISSVRTSCVYMYISNLYSSLLFISSPFPSAFCSQLCFLSFFICKFAGICSYFSCSCNIS